MNILGVRVDNLSKKEILEKIELFLNENKFHQIGTVNPEFILEAEKNDEFKRILNSSDLNVADGIGLKYAFFRYGGWLKERLAGVDLMHEILNIADKKISNVFLAVNEKGLSTLEDTKTVLEKLYPHVNFFGEEINPADTAYHLEPITCDLLFCNFGAPAQEKFINSVKNDTINLAMGVGGAFDFLTGKVKRAPKVMRFLGLEWLWRVIIQPWRWKRILNAVIVFPIKIILHKSNARK